MARHNSRVMALIGNGAQSEFQALAFHRLLGIRELRLFDVDSPSTDKPVRNLSRLPALADPPLHTCTRTPEAAVSYHPPSRPSK